MSIMSSMALIMEHMLAINLLVTENKEPGIIIRAGFYLFMAVGREELKWKLLLIKKIV